MNEVKFEESFVIVMLDVSCEGMECLKVSRMGLITFFRLLESAKKISKCSDNYYIASMG